MKTYIVCTARHLKKDDSAGKMQQNVTETHLFSLEDISFGSPIVSSEVGTSGCGVTTGAG
jgi:hypothetical protein